MLGVGVAASPDSTSGICSTVTRLSSVVSFSRTLISFANATHRAVRVQPLPKICFRANAADGVPGLFRFALCPL